MQSRRLQVFPGVRIAWHPRRVHESGHPPYRDNEGSRFYRAGRLSPEETWRALGDELRTVRGVRIVSLVPHATELLFALGLGPEVVAVTHECDHPHAALAVERVTRDVLPPGLNAAEIDAAVRERTLRGEAIYQLDREAIVALRPDLIVTQALCPVCAVSYTEVAELAEKMPSRPRVVSLDPHTLDETLEDTHTLAAATARRERGAELVAETTARIERIELAVHGRRRPRVVALEWLDPVYVAGHWTPELVELAGGQDVLGTPGEPSAMVSWEAVVAAEAEIVVVMPCGYDAPRAHAEALAYAPELTALAASRVVAVNASAYFSRPGPRLVDGLELLARILHPELLTDAPDAALPVELSHKTSRALTRSK
jgi:iron complex transport system substrate-binding protein